MIANPLTNRPGDRTYLLVLTSYGGFLLVFSSFFYLATEDYEATVAVRLIGNGIPIGKNTGWPYMPLEAYLFYLHSLVFGDGILGFRILTTAFLVASIFPTYLTLRHLCSPFIAFALTMFSFSLVTFPHPRLEYYIEGAFLSFSIFFAVRSISSSEQKHIYLAAVFLFAGFASRGYPNAGLLVFLLPTALLLVHQTLKNDRAVLSQEPAELRPWSKAALVWLVLAAPCFGFLIKFLQRAVYRISFFEYASLIAPTDLRSIQDYRRPIVFVLLGILIILFGLFSLRPVSRRLDIGRMSDWQLQPNRPLTALQILLPFLICGFLFVFAFYIIGQPIEHIYFFFFPLDIVIDHMDQLATGRSYVIPLWAFLSIAIICLSSKYGLGLKQAKKTMFFVLCLPFAFTRSFPGFNMLYFISFILAIFITLMIPVTVSALSKTHHVAISARLQHSLAAFFLLYALGSNAFLLLKTQFSDLRFDNVAQIWRRPVSGIWIEKDVIKFFEDVDESLRSIDASGENIAFFSNRYLNYVPLVYGYRDVLAGQNLVTGLGKTWSYDDVLRIEAKKIDSRWNRKNVIYTWREIAVNKLENAGADIIVISLYDTETTKEMVKPSSDPFREYLRKNFVIRKIIEPNMKLHRRSRFSEGAVILTRTKL